MFENILMLITFGLCLVSFLSVIPYRRKVLWLPFVIIVQLGALAFFYFLLSFFFVGYSKLLCVMFNVVCIFVSMAGYVKKKLKADYNKKPNASVKKKILDDFKKFDFENVLAFALILIFAFCIGIERFGIMPEISFVSSDAAYHWGQSDDIANGGIVEGQYLSHLFDGIFISLFQNTNPYFSIAIFTYAEMALLGLSGMMFYSTISVYCPKLGIPWKLVLTFLYVTGYPLTNLLYGFSYLGIGVTVLCGILFIGRAAYCKKPTVPLCLIFSLLLFELVVSYVLFLAPVCAAILAIALMDLKSKRMAPREALTRLMVVFFIPALVFFLIVYPHYFANSGATVQSGLAREGNTYRDLFSSFVFVLPIALYGVSSTIRLRENRFLCATSVLFVSFAVCLFVLCLFQRVSTYYFYKLYFVVWLLAFIYASVGIMFLKKRAMTFLVSYSCVWALVFVLCMPGVGSMLSKRNEYIYPVETTDFASVYNFNFQDLDAFTLPAGEVELFEVADELRDADYTIVNLNSDVIMRWNLEIYNLSTTENNFQWWWYTAEELKEIVSQYDYILIVDHNPQIRNQQGELLTDVLSCMELDYGVYFENQYGRILSVSHNEASMPSK